MAKKLSSQMVDMLLDTYETARFVALAYGTALPVAPGWTGPSASGWTIRDTQQPPATSESWVGHDDSDERTSEGANRRAREANIRAIRGVCESSFVPAGVTISIQMRDKEVVTTFNTILSGQTKKTNGKLFANWELWEEVRSIIREKKLRLRGSWVEKGEDMEMDLLEERVKSAARERDEQLEHGRLLNTALPPKPKKPPFPPVDEE